MGAGVERLGRVLANELEVKTSLVVRDGATIEGLPTGTEYVLPAATETVLGGVRQLPVIADSTASTIAGTVTDFNALLAALRAAGIIAQA
jgi:hypothetical protein